MISIHTQYKLFKLSLFTAITKQIIQLILIMLVGAHVCVWMVFVCEETGVPGGNLSDLVTTLPSHMPTPGIEPG